ncbi:hypothetical protein J0K78_06945 [Halobacillus sp. GSS1]|uniref:hypothetical protein n=1 Tax=Halobacillus sp. GSS1 TaxID=2815919 RepID=UPI001A8FCC33|nr:hypothetical protein [Halobacillus sp. GSS1]MBN9653995.1 hypothetical protein [Halobacillus sp. GSS1]
MKKRPSQPAILLISAFILIIFALFIHLWGGEQWIGNVSLFTGFTMITYLEYFSNESIVLGYLYFIQTTLVTLGVFKILMPLFLVEFKFESYIRIGASLFIHHWVVKGIKVRLKKEESEKDVGHCF